MKTLNLETAAAFQFVSEYTLQELAASGTVPGAKIGKCRVFADEDLEAYVRDEVRRQTAERRGGKLAVFFRPLMPKYTILVRTFTNVVHRSCVRGFNKKL